MKTASAPLIALLATGVFVRADLYIITLKSGTAIYWTDADGPIVWGGHTHTLGPLIERDQISEGVGAEVSSMNISLTADTTDLISGVQVISYIRQRGFYGATIKLLTAYAPDWTTMYGAGPTGIVTRFFGRMGAISEAGDMHIDFSVISWTELLNSSMPRNVYQSFCMHSLYDTGCTLSKATFAVAGTVVAGITPTQLRFKTGLAAAVGWYDLGMILFTSGANNGQRRTVKDYVAGSIVDLVLPLPAAPALGDTFTIYPGCDLLHTTCATKFSNQTHFKGTPFVPTVETGL